MARQYGAPPEDERRRNNEDKGYSARRDREPKTKDPEASPDSKTVELFHKNAEVDKRRESIHHTLGPNSFQASPGDHSHNGDDSILLLEGYTITGSIATPSTLMPSIIAALVRLGATDGTS